MRWTCILLPQLAIDAALRLRPDDGLPHALVDGPAQRRVLHALDRRARDLGLHQGMALAMARQQAPELRAQAHDPRLEVEARELLALWAYGLSSQVSLALADAIVLEIAGSRRLLGAWPALCRRMTSELAAMGFQHHLVAAPNPHAAWVLAGVHRELGVDQTRLLQALGQVPVERSGLPAEAVATLHHSGLRRLRQVFDLPRASLARRFGPELPAQLDRLRAHEAAPLPPFAPPERFAARIEFDYAVESSHGLLFALRRLTADLATFVSCRDGGVQRFSLVFEHERHPSSTLVVGLLAPERAPAMLFELARSRLEHLRLPAAIRALGLCADELPAFVPAARDLFDARPQQALPWESLRERLRARLGDAAVQDVVLHPDHRPERATRSPGAVRESAGPRALPAHGKLAVREPAGPLATNPPAPLPRRPAWLLPRPIRLHGAVEVIEGPERIEAGWWDGSDVQRDYAIVRTGDGQQAWAFRSPLHPGQWWLHGWFA